MSTSLLPSLKPPLGIYYNPGMGYSPAAAGPTGGWSYTPGPGFFGQQSMESLLPRSFGTVRRRRSFGYPLMNRPSSEINMQMFPRYPVGVGSTPGGNGGVLLQGMPSFQQYWGFGDRRRARRAQIKREKQQRKQQRRRQRSRRNKKCLACRDF
jgi:hypothetical protein